MESIVTSIRKVAAEGEDSWGKVEAFFEENKGKSFSVYDEVIRIKNLKLVDIGDKDVMLDGGGGSVRIPRSYVERVIFRGKDLHIQTVHYGMISILVK